MTKDHRNILGTQIIRSGAQFNIKDKDISHAALLAIAMDL